MVGTQSSSVLGHIVGDCADGGKVQQTGGTRFPEWRGTHSQTLGQIILQFGGTENGF